MARTIQERNALVQNNIKLAYSVANKLFRRSGIVRRAGYEEAVSAAMLALTLAAQDWDETFDGAAPFGVFAWIYINRGVVRSAYKFLGLQKPRSDRNFHFVKVCSYDHETWARNNVPDTSFDRDKADELADAISAIKSRFSEDEANVLLMRAQGYSYDEISQRFPSINRRTLRRRVMLMRSALARAVGYDLTRKNAHQTIESE